MTNQDNDKGEANSGRPKGSSGDVVVIGESPSALTVSLQTVQGIYNELTGKSEEVSKSYDKPIRVRFTDIEQLDHKINQACEQYNIVSGNCSATIYYVDDTRDRFSSFERFRLHNAGSPSPVESILLKYNFLLLLPKTREPQSYTLSVRLASRVAVMRRMEREFFGPPAGIMRLMGNRTAVIEIQYVDYMVARNLLNLVDEWFQCIPVAPEYRVLNWLRQRSHFIPRFVRFATAMFVGFLIVTLLPSFVAQDSTDLYGFGVFVSYSLIGVFAAYKASDFFAGLVEDAIDEWTEVSYINITKGDQIEIDKAGRRNTFYVFKAISSLLLSIAVSVVAKVVANIIVP